MSEFQGLPVRGAHIDLKAHTMTPAMMAATARDLARMGYNTILLEYQDKFPYTGRLAPIASEDAMTREEAAAFDALCTQLGIRIIPLVQCLGHMYYVLRHAEFADMAEPPAPGRERDCLCPSDERSFGLFREMVAQVLEVHPSCRYVHIGGDEAALSAACPACGDTPKHELLNAHYTKCIDLILSGGRKPVMWCDMLLGHPETLEPLRGKVVVMDWDYWSTGRPGCKPIVWGCRDKGSAEEWDDIHKKLIRPYVYELEPWLTRPFPFVRFLKDQGFEVLVAPAARSGGDACFLPQSLHVPNCREAVRTAAKNDALGVVVTSWSARRSPWPLTENSLVAAAALMRDPGLTDEETDRAFARDSFGVDDAELGAMPFALFDALHDAADTCDLSTTGTVHPFEDVGRPDTYEMRRKARGQTWLGNEAIAPAYERVLEAAARAEALLERACPQNARQYTRVMLWQWSIDCARVLAKLAPYLAKGSVPADKAEELLGDFAVLRAAGESYYDRRYTAAGKADDSYHRYGVHEEWIRAHTEK